MCTAIAVELANFKIVCSVWEKSNEVNYHRAINHHHPPTIQGEIHFENQILRFENTVWYRMISILKIRFWDLKMQCDTVWNSFWKSDFEIWKCSVIQDDIRFENQILRFENAVWYRVITILKIRFWALKIQCDTVWYSCTVLKIRFWDLKTRDERINCGGPLKTLWAAKLNSERAIMKKSWKSHYEDKTIFGVSSGEKQGCFDVFTDIYDIYV